MNSIDDVVVVPNESFGPGPYYEGWICEHACPQIATFDGQVIVCEACCELLDEGAKIVDESGRSVLVPSAGVV